MNEPKDLKHCDTVRAKKVIHLPGLFDIKPGSTLLVLKPYKTKDYFEYVYEAGIWVSGEEIDFNEYFEKV